MKLYSRISKASGADVIYSQRDVEEIFAAAGGIPDPSRLPEFAEELNEFAQTYLVNRHMQSTTVPPSVILKKLNRIEKPARKLLNELSLSVNSNVDDVPMHILARLRRGAEQYGRSAGGYPDLPLDEGVPPYMGYRGEERLRTVLSDMQEFVSWIEEEIRFVQTDLKMNAGKPRHKGDEALNQLLGSLFHLFVDAFERLPKVSFNAYAEEGGGDTPFFLMCLKKFRENVSDEQKECDRELVEDLTLSPEAIRARLGPTIRRMVELGSKQI